MAARNLDVLCNARDFCDLRDTLPPFITDDEMFLLDDLAGDMLIDLGSGFAPDAQGPALVGVSPFGASPEPAPVPVPVGQPEPAPVPVPMVQPEQHCPDMPLPLPLPEAALPEDEALDEQAALVEIALINFAAYNDLLPGSVSIARVEATSAGITGWAGAAPLSPPATSACKRGAPEEEEEETTEWEIVEAVVPAAKRARRCDLEEEASLRRALLASVGVVLPAADVPLDEEVSPALYDEEEEDEELQGVTMAEEEGFEVVAAKAGRPPSVNRKSWQWKQVEGSVALSGSAPRPQRGAGGLSHGLDTSTPNLDTPSTPLSLDTGSTDSTPGLDTSTPRLRRPPPATEDDDLDEQWELV
ncbi:hypothetical protein EMIHUDRAFT_441358 [Emiliania huxleyi CCMP1516]|uniref:Uncharacterized protein n=2 Tax=Emiliania huxleyi TaxID=2903 RepID=A0A0D3KE56_EMIH1|nr:hypothetical protein EMIHUDRAFT_441358 [Emiliania huxleyi CCMP1516]EOD34041.1 hypothetical protein EMIHUDRAFT_441358 [Emiliania huxleyi CCMP1516]|eukprot:XP_005786470.1 hypothetical protein EMIHUDRAFT_441358 [Emiliania huxleyi CCMP1516]